MRRAIVVAAVVAAVCGCDKKKAAPAEQGGGSGTATVAGSGTASGTASGTGSGTGTGTGSDAGSGSGSGSGAEVADCIDGPTMGTILGIDGPEIQVQCAVGKFPMPGTFVEATIVSDDPARRVGILAPDRKTQIVKFVETPIAPGELDSSGSTFAAHDLDGDGIDEIVESWGSDRRGYVIGTVAVHRVEKDKLVAIGDPLPVSYDDGAAVADGETSSCEGNHAVEPAAKGKHVVITVATVSGKPSAENCMKKGKHLFALVGDKLLPVR